MLKENLELVKYRSFGIGEIKKDLNKEIKKVTVEINQSRNE